MPKSPNAILCVLTNAGTGGGWPWTVRESARTDRGWHFWSAPGCVASWISQADIEQQRRILPPAAFARLFLNHWQRESGDFVSRVEAVACEDASLNYRHRDDCGQCYVAAIDYGERKDRSVATLLHREGDLLIVDRMEVWQGSPADPVPLAAVEQWIADVADRFHRPLFMINPFQMLSTIQKFEPQFAVERGEARNGRGNYQLALNLRSLIVGRRIKWYPDCGRIMDCKGKVSTLTDELCSVICSETSYGWKIDHHSSEHDDRVVSLAMAALKAMDLPAEAADPHAGIVTEDAELVEQIELKYQEWSRLSAPWGIPPT